MCGFLGVVGEVGSNQFLEALLKIEHRGPDAHSVVELDDVKLGHVRLSILDLTKAGTQPMSSKCGRYTIAYNGEVYNFKELASEYHLDGLKTRTDTEVILRLFAKLGVESFKLLNGMFAFAIYDSLEKKLFLARDRLGIKPLLLFKSSTHIAFSSEIKALDALGLLEHSVNKDALHEWSYYGNTLGKNTLWPGVQRVLPGKYLEVDIDDREKPSIQEHSYWSVEQQVANKRVFSGSLDDAIVDTQKHLQTAVTRQLVSDVPVGVFLSGGIDSSAITAIAGRELGSKLSTYSVKFDFDEYANELPKARMVAQRYGTDHHEFEIGVYDVADTVVKMVHHHDHPFSDAANIPLFLLAEQVKHRTKVILQGDGGDELFAGYQRYKTLGQLPVMRLAARIGRPVNEFLPKNAGYYSRRRYINALFKTQDYELMSALLTVEDDCDPPTRVFESAVRAQIEAMAYNLRYKVIEQDFQEEELVNRMLAVDAKIILPDIFLEKVDRATMAASVEVRVPFLDNDLVGFCLSLPANYKLRKGQQKYLLKKALEGMVPNDILYGPKTGFGVPFGYWLRGALKELFFDNLKTFISNNPNVLSENVLQQLFREHTERKRDHGFLLWKTLNLLLWANLKRISFH
jgi:asparagine synthase (glutamine-hydrolysing)